MRARIGSLLALGAVLTLASCKDQSSKETGIIVEVTSNLVVPEEINQVRVIAQDPQDNIVFEQIFDLGPGANQVGLPLRTGLRPHHETGTPMHVQAVAQVDGEAVVSRSATLSFIQGEQVVLPLRLLAVCKPVKCEGRYTTCKDNGVCQPDGEDSTKLPTYTPNKSVPGQDAASPRPEAGRDAAVADANPDGAGGVDGRTVTDGSAGDSPATSGTAGSGGGSTESGRMDGGAGGGTTGSGGARLDASPDNMSSSGRDGGGADGGTARSGDARPDASPDAVSSSGGVGGGAGGSTTGSGGARPDASPDAVSSSGGVGGSTTGSGGARPDASPDGTSSSGGVGGSTAGSGGVHPDASPDSATSSGGAGASGSSYCPSGTPCAILPVGDSITEGCCTAPMGGYRIELFRQAMAQGKNFTFVGNLQNGPASVDGQVFIKNHEGHGGWKISQIAEIIDQVLSTTTPNIVLLMIGTNDINGNVDIDNAPNRLESLISQITQDAPAALLVVSSVIPMTSDSTNQRLQSYNTAIKAKAEAAAAAGKNVVFVDNYAAFMQSPNYKTALMSDALHPNSAGYTVLGSNFYQAIADHLPSQ